MKTANDVVRGEIVDVTPEGIVTIKARYDDWVTLTKRGYKECNVQMIDSRPLSSQQRRTCYMLLRELAEWSGMEMDAAKEYMKIKFLVDEFQETGEKIFSLSDAPMSVVCAFQRFLVRFMLEWDVPCRFSLLKFVDDVADYVYACLINRKCCICGRHADLHHVDHVGIGRDREEIIHEGMHALPLCREHHGEVHQRGKQGFEDMYHVGEGIVLDKTLCKIYGIKARREKKHESVPNRRGDGCRD